jgi:CheY-like chemotaxis protein
MKPVKLNSPIGKIESGVGNWFNQFWRKAPFAGLMLLVAGGVGVADAGSPSTEGVGQGTGLGLSTCYGILKQSGGHISVYSELARGATFKIYLPQVEPQTKIPLDGIEALSLKQQRDSGHIDLLFTDVVMPHMSGKELADRVRASYPHTRILFTSAYTENAMVHQGVLNQGVALLQKPFTPSALAHKLREVLDQPGASLCENSTHRKNFAHIFDMTRFDEMSRGFNGSKMSFHTGSRSATGPRAENIWLHKNHR